MCSLLMERPGFSTSNHILGCLIQVLKGLAHQLESGSFVGDRGQVLLVMMLSNFCTSKPEHGNNHGLFRSA